LGDLEPNKFMTLTSGPASDLASAVLLAPGAETNAFRFTINSGCVPGTDLPLTATLTDAWGNNWTKTLTIAAVVPDNQVAIRSPSVNNYALKETANGNDDGRVNPGESLYLDLRLHNSGAGKVLGLSVDLETSSEYVTVGTGHVEIGDLSAGNYRNMTGYEIYYATTFLWQDLSKAFHFTVSSTCPIGEDLSFTVTYADAWDNQWTETLIIPVLASDANVTIHTPREGNYKVHEVSGGNNDGFLNKGESHYLDIRVRNSGTSKALAVQAALSTENPYVTIISDEAILGDINAGYYKTLTAPASASAPALLGNTAGAFSFTISAGCPEWSGILFTISLSDSWGNHWEDELFMPVLGAGTVTIPSGGNLIAISTQEELAGMSNGHAYVLVNDIALTGTWIPLRGSRYNAFSGNFYGGNHLISNLVVTAYDLYLNNIIGVGLFGNTNAAIIQDLCVSTGSISLEWSIERFGVLTGLAQNTKFSNVKVYQTPGTSISFTFTGGEDHYLGGLVGYLDSASEISDCSAEIAIATYNGACPTGGLAGRSDGTIQRSYASYDASVSTINQRPVGGLVGDNTGTIEQSYFAGRLNFTGYVSTGVGGIAGLNSGTIRSCYFSGLVSNTFGNGTNPTTTTGGISAQNTGTIEGCYVSGEVQTLNNSNYQSWYTARAAGLADGGIIKNSAALSGQLYINCQQGKNFGRIALGGGSLTNNYAFSGMILSYSGNGPGDSGTVAVTDAETNPQNDINGQGKTAVQLKLQSTYQIVLGWDFTNVWEMGPVSYPYPIFQWQNGDVHIPTGFTVISD
jgi:hypothetical protein